jgi:hypothetical protein
MICPKCQYVTGAEFLIKCPQCGAEISDEQYDNEIQWVNVYTTNTELDANMYKANLEGAGIPAQVLLQVDSMRQLTLGDLAIAKIFVPSEQVVEAQEIIKAIENNEGLEE